MFADLESKLSDNKGARTKLIVTDGVFSMDGNVAPLRYNHFVEYVNVPFFSGLCPMILPITGMSPGD